MANRVHSLTRMNRGVDSTWARFAGIDTKVFSGQIQGDTAERDSGYSGNPLSMIPFRPDRSPEPLLYVGDANKLRKFKTNGDDYQVGIAPPTAPPSVKIGVPAYKVVQDFEQVLDWNVNGTASLLEGVVRFDTTISSILYDSGTAGWASVIPVSPSSIRPGCLMKFGNTETARVREVFPDTTSTTIASIRYDSGSSGPCTIALTASSPLLRPNFLMRISGSELVKVFSVHEGPNGTQAIRTSTVSTYAAGASIAGVFSFRVYLQQTWAATDAIVGSAVKFTVAEGLGSISCYDLSLDLSQIGNRKISPDDYIHISLLVDKPENVSEGRVALDVDNASDVHDFKQNLYYRAFRSSDLTPNAINSLTYITTASRAEYFSTVGNAVQQLVSGSAQWTEMVFKVSDLIRVGADPSKTLANVNALLVQLIVTGTTVCIVDSWWVGGTYGPDVASTGTPLQYAYRYRSSTTGAKSNPSPIIRTLVDVYRERVSLSVTASADPQVDKIELCRFGGGLTGWKVVGTFPNTTADINDDISAIASMVNEDVAFDNYQPYPVSDMPKAGTVNTIGSMVVWASGDKFNLNWVPGSQIIINGLTYTLYAHPYSDTWLEIVECAGTQTGSAFTIPEATIAAQPLPVVWSMGGQGLATYMMGVGDPYGPGFLRYCKGNDPDAASDKGYLEITSPSEPLMNGCEFDGRGFVFSNSRMFALFPDNQGGFSSQIVANIGLYARYGLVVTPYGIAFVGKDGVYLWSGGEPKPLTDTLYPLFPHEFISGKTPSGLPQRANGIGQPVNGYQPIDYTSPNLLRLFYANHRLYFLYPDISGVDRCLLYDFTHGGGWYPLDFTPALTSLLAEENGGSVDDVIAGAADGTIHYLSSSPTDNGTAIHCEIRTPSMDMGDSRSEKLFLDSMLQSHPPSSGLFCTLGFNNHSITLAPTQVSGSGIQQTTLPISVNGLTLYRNISLDIQWDGVASLYEFQPNALLQPYMAPAFVRQFTGHGWQNYGHIKEGWVGLISTDVVTLSISVDGADPITYTIPSTAGKYLKVLVPMRPHKGKMMSYKLSSPTPFVLFADETLFAIKEWGVDDEFSAFRPFSGMLHS